MTIGSTDSGATRWSKIVGNYQIKEGLPDGGNFIFLIEISEINEEVSLGREVRSENGEQVTYFFLAEGDLKKVTEN